MKVKVVSRTELWAAGLVCEAFRLLLPTRKILARFGCKAYRLLLVGMSRFGFSSPDSDTDYLNLNLNSFS